MRSGRILVRVDFRERKSGVPEFLERRGDVRVRMETLRVGDYALGNAAGVERKTWRDFARSVVDGRLFRQVIALRCRYDRPVLILEGFAFGAGISGVGRPQLRGALTSVTTVLGVPILFSSGPEETAEMLATAAWQLKRISGDAYRRPGYRPKGFRKRALFILQGLPFVGPRRAAALFDAFGSVRDVVSADEESLLRVPYVGPEVAAAVRKAVGRRPVDSEKNLGKGQ